MRFVVGLLAGFVVLVSACGDDSSGNDAADATDVAEAVDVEVPDVRVEAGVEDAAAADVAPDEGVAEDAGFDGADVDEAQDVEPEADVEVGGDADAADDGGVCTAEWRDPITGYVWENAPSPTVRLFDAATSYCDGLSLCGHPAGSWHLPTVSELRSLIRGCPATQAAGTCGVMDRCLDFGCSSPSCNGCPASDGPGLDGCFWDPGARGSCAWYWSSSSCPADTTYAWLVGFDDAHVGYARKTSTMLARCVRRDP